jgi:CheY-like chemotaxis protein
VRGQGIQVLVVDDDAPSAKLMAIVLRSEGFEVRVAPSAEDALAMLDEYLPRVVVLDLILPLMSGLVLAERLRQSPLMADALVVAVTVFNGPEAERMALSAGCDLYVRKPIDPDTFCDLLVAHLKELA